MSSLIPLPQGPREIRKATGKIVTYNHLYKAVLDGDVEAEHYNGRWYLKPANILEIAKVLAA